MDKSRERNEVASTYSPLLTSFRVMATGLGVDLERELSSTLAEVGIVVGK